MTQALVAFAAAALAMLALPEQPARAAEPAAPACPASPVTPASPWSGWIAPPANGAALQLGHVHEAALAQADKGYAGDLTLTVTQAGTYRIALSGPGWIDVSAGSGKLASTGHSHGAPCSGIRKIVAFALQPGTYRVSLTQSPAPRVRVMVVAD